MKTLIVTADDFGLTKSVNQGIALAYTEGLVNYINLMPAGEAFEDALVRIRSLKNCEIGAHLAITETKPVTNIRDVSTLVDKNGNFPKGYPELLAGIISKKIDMAHMRLELSNQLERIVSTGLPVTCLSSHEHIHMMPGIMDLFIDIAKERRIPYIRYFFRERFTRPVTIKKLYKLLVLSCLGRVGNGKMRSSGLSYIDHILGFFDSGRLREDLLVSMLSALEDGVTELVCHPGFLGPEVVDRYKFHINCETELYGLTSKKVKAAIESNGVTLTTFGQLPL